MKKSILSLTVLTFIWITSFTQIDTISTNIYQNDGKLGIGNSNPSANVSISSDDIYDFYEKLLELRINGISDSYLQFRNNTSASNVFEPAIHGSNSDPDKAGLMIYGNIFEDGDNDDNAIITVTPFVDNGLGWENNGYDFPTNRHYFRVRGFKSGVGNKYLFEIDQNGNIGIGTKTPRAKLEITDGDIYLSDIEKGIIMKSPNGQCWRGTLDNFGNLNFTQIACPEVTTSMTEELIKPNQVSIFPNPTENTVRINIENGELKNMKYFVFDVNGKMLKHGKMKNNNQLLDFSSFDSGMYLIKINDKKGKTISTNRVIKK